jgi:trehalose 6-phosphate phosphatase
VLAALAPRGHHVAVVSGRPVSFLREQLAAPGVALFGLYGLEAVAPDGVVRTGADAERWRPVVAAAADDAERALPGVLVERKGLSVTVHVRTAPDLEDEAFTWVRAYAVTSGLELHPARRSWELRPPEPHGKGDVASRLLDGVAAACFVGDDRGDLPAFDALDRAEADGTAVARVAVASDEAPAELLERADLILDGPTAVVDFLRELLG